ncbi:MULTISPECIES: dihydrodipicolinate reductase [unclassified Mycolicibacterium]|uniref:NAD(P)H-dependent amine dehydrogenase family protein n=1 Tax=unclassified Mycolicibacterium TaxID=2636767 RepID=UPI001309B6A6|nr:MULTISPECIES: dihydrodipicolinate reductase [unclassified Mycolicibacterium]MUL83341.1 dihydrodipicolinate reductase [Mycolicibacterium sp. CBMA 329]MUL90332.1 dihydrodipicolinate reductase [Mycolicibacterium sp. CBMA 331]MUM00306.1 dihydrodipicolinate reductase [Mycolicibacterium sp. CBMA 334]MUM26491.1 dihydrodipicolinate reductase [Mycolicibacterium sp. CBMA 295]MUM41276.1 dihydrodipicolinate reductase [Mycolicibacterium sp. CBMA 247]
MTDLRTDRYRVAQWATGTIGTHALRSIIEHPHLELAAVHVFGADKVGADAGDLCGVKPTGITATGRIEAILDAAPDCVLYMPAAPDIEQLCRLLAAGINVVSTCGQFHHPASIEPALHKAVTEACLRGNATLYATGSSPGFITEAIPLALTSVQRRLNLLAIDEYADLSRRNSPELLFDVMGFGGPAGPFDQRRAAHLQASFGPSLRLVADAIGLPLDSVHTDGQWALAARDTTIRAGRLAAGTVAAQRITVSGLRSGRQLLRFQATWYCGTDLTEDWDLRPSGWHLTVDGDAPLDIDVRMPIPLDRMAAVSPGYTANRAVNAVPSVCAADAGIRSTLDLPQIVAAMNA